MVCFARSAEDVGELQHGPEEAVPRDASPDSHARLWVCNVFGRLILGLGSSGGLAESVCYQLNIVPPEREREGR